MQVRKIFYLCYSIPAEMNASDQVRAYVVSHYIVPARKRGLGSVTVRAGDVHKALKWDLKRVPQVCSALATNKFLRSAHLELVARKGPPSGQSTTVEFTYRLLDPEVSASRNLRASAPKVQDGTGLEALYGIFEQEFKSLGGGEAFLRAERGAWGPDPWEKLEMERREREEKAG